MAIREIAADVGRSLIAHWVTSLIIAGITLGLPYWGAVTEHWSWPTAISVGLVVLAALLSILRGSRFGRTYAKRADLSLRVHADERKPERISATNIGRWFTLEGIELRLVDGTAPQRVVGHTILFVTFDP